MRNLRCEPDDLAARAARARAELRRESFAMRARATLPADGSRAARALAPSADERDPRRMPRCAAVIGRGDAARGGAAAPVAVRPCVGRRAEP